MVTLLFEWGATDRMPKMIVAFIDRMRAERGRS